MSTLRSLLGRLERLEAANPARYENMSTDDLREIIRGYADELELAGELRFATLARAYATGTELTDDEQAEFLALVHGEGDTQCS